MKIDDYIPKTPQELKEILHNEDVANRPERHNPTSYILDLDSDLCMRCRSNWIHRYWFDARCYIMRRIKDY